MKLLGIDPSCENSFKGSPDPSHFIFEIDVGERRIRHRTTLKLNDEFQGSLKTD